MLVSQMTLLSRKIKIETFCSPWLSLTWKKSTCKSFCFFRHKASPYWHSLNAENSTDYGFGVTDVQKWDFNNLPVPQARLIISSCYFLLCWLASWNRCLWKRQKEELCLMFHAETGYEWVFTSWLELDL